MIQGLSSDPVIIAEALTKTGQAPFRSLFGRFFCFARKAVPVLLGVLSIFVSKDLVSVKKDQNRG